MKKKIYLTVLIIIFLFCVKTCIKKDTPQAPIQIKSSVAEKTVKSYPPRAKNITINGIDYLQSQFPIGKFGGNFIVSTIGEGPKTFNPFNTKDATSSAMAELMYDGLLTTDPLTGEIIPKLAKSYQILPDKKTYIIYLRKGLKWSDKKPITAEDVIFTWDKIIFAGLGNTSTRDSIVIDGKLPEIKKIDDYTIKFTTSKPFAPFLRFLSTPIAPKHIFEPAVNKGEDYFNSYLSTNAKPKDFVTNGAFKLKEYVAAQRVVFEKNPDYYIINTKNKKLPYIDKLVYLIVGDLNNEILKFESKELDMISLRGANVSRFKEKEANSDYKIYNIAADTSTLFLAFNLNNRKNEKGDFYISLNKQFWFSDLNFRTAVDYAIDRENMIFNIANGLAKPLFTPESLNSVFVNEKIKGHERDIAYAKELLKRSGFWQNKQGQLFDKFNNKVEFDLYTNAGNTEREAIGVMIKQDLADLGIQINFKPVEFNSLVNKLVNTTDFDTVIMGLTGSPLEPHSGKNVWYSNGALHLFNQRNAKEKNVSLYPFEKKLDEIFDKGALELNFYKRKRLYDEYQKIIYDEKPLLYLYSPIRIVAIRKKIQNVYPTPLSGAVYNLEEIWVDN